MQNTAECTIEYWVDSENILLCVIHYYSALLEYEMNTSSTSVDVNYFAEYCRVYNLRQGILSCDALCVMLMYWEWYQLHIVGVCGIIMSLLLMRQYVNVWI